MSNQFTNPTSLSDYQDVLKRPEVSAMVQDIEQKLRDIEEAGDKACHTVQVQSYKTSMFQTRHNGKKVWFSIRALLWVKSFGTLPVFGSCTCGTPGCVVPSHQVVKKDQRENPAGPRSMSYVFGTVNAA